MEPPRLPPMLTEIHVEDGRLVGTLPDSTLVYGRRAVATSDIVQIDFPGDGE